MSDRDWQRDLWSTSFKGVPFWCEKDENGFGKRLVVHQFFGVDAPFIEDAGADVETFEIVAYMVGDTADLETAALKSALLPAGAGTLVLPAEGPVQARFHKARRSRERDRMGYFAFTLSFIKEGSALSLQPANMLAQLVYDAAAAVETAATSLLASVVLQ